jgi:hypothetical protein
MQSMYPQRTSNALNAHEAARCVMPCRGPSSPAGRAATRGLHGGGSCPPYSGSPRVAARQVQHWRRGGGAAACSTASCQSTRGSSWGAACSSSSSSSSSSSCHGCGPGGEHCQASSKSQVSPHPHTSLPPHHACPPSAPHSRVFAQAVAVAAHISTSRCSISGG